MIDLVGLIIWSWLACCVGSVERVDPRACRYRSCAGLCWGRRRRSGLGPQMLKPRVRALVWASTPAWDSRRGLRSGWWLRWSRHCVEHGPRCNLTSSRWTSARWSYGGAHVVPGRNSACGVRNAHLKQQKLGSLQGPQPLRPQVDRRWKKQEHCQQ